MNLMFLAHASFLITTSKGTRIITDPYKAGCFSNSLRYKPIKESCDVVLVSHNHDDHNGTNEVLGKFQILEGEGDWTVKDIKVSGISSFHDTQKGSARGKNTIFIIEADSLRIVHLGDLGHTLTEQDYQRLGAIDVLLTPVGGYFTIDSKAATEIVNKLKPKVTIPMHYKTTALDFPLVQVDDFLKDKKNIKKFDKSEVVISSETLPNTPEIWVLKMANE